MYVGAPAGGRARWTACSVAKRSSETAHSARMEMVLRDVKLSLCTRR